MAGLLVGVLARHPEVRIVLSTSWVREWRFERARQTSWVAVDDSPEGWGQADQHRIIQTDGARGLSHPGARSRRVGLLE